MRLVSALYLFVLVAIAGVGAWGWVRESQNEEQIRRLDFVRQRADFLEAENAHLAAVLADKQRFEALVEEHRQRDAIEKTVAGLSGLKFLHPVVFREIPRADLPSILSQKLTQQVPDREFGSVALELSALGLIPAGMDLKKVYLDLLGEQIGAFYDQHTHELFTFSEHPLTNSQNRVVMAHELTHALQDQHFDLLKLPLETKGNDDRALAASALVEGDATLVMDQYLTGDLSAAVLRESLAGAFSTDVRQLASAPRYLRETLLFPYLQGQRFVTALTLHGGRAAVSGAFRDPPASTSQIMHPEKYLAQPREQPVRVEFANTVALGREPAVDNVLGEFTVQQILETWTKDKARANALAAAWRGDRILVYGEAGAYSYAWQTEWRDAAAAKAYCQTARAGLAMRYADKKSDVAALESSGGELAAAEFSLNSGGRQVRVILTGAETLLVDAQDSQWAEVLTHLVALHPANQ